MWAERHDLPSVCRFDTFNAQNNGHKDEAHFLKMNKLKFGRNKIELSIQNKLFNETEPTKSNHNTQPANESI